MKVSIITVCYNAESTIADSLRSIENQTYPDIELIVIDGASTDKTVDVVKATSARVTAFVSEPDNGIYHAMNKGLALATGDVVGFLNADDFYATDTALESVAQCFADPDVDVVYGDLCYVSKDRPGEIVRYWKSSEYKSGQFERGWCPPHPTFFVRRAVYEQPGGYYDTDFRLASDLDFIVRCLAVKRLHSRYIPEVLVNMRLGGETNQSIANIVSQNLEILRAFKKNGLRTNAVQFVAAKVVSRVRQFLMKPPA